MEGLILLPLLEKWGRGRTTTPLALPPAPIPMAYIIKYVHCYNYIYPGCVQQFGIQVIATGSHHLKLQKESLDGVAEVFLAL